MYPNISFIPYFPLLVFAILVTLVAWFSFCFFFCLAHLALQNVKKDYVFEHILFFIFSSRDLWPGIYPYAMKISISELTSSLPVTKLTYVPKSFWPLMPAGVISTNSAETIKTHQQLSKVSGQNGISDGLFLTVTNVPLFITVIRVRPKLKVEFTFRWV